MIGRFVHRNVVPLLGGALAMLWLAPEVLPPIAYVSEGGCALLTLPDLQVSPAMGSLQRGTAVAVEEQRDGYVRVMVRGWIPAAQLDATPPLSPLADAEGAQSSAPKEIVGVPQPSETRAVVSGLNHVHSFDLLAEARRSVAADGESLARGTLHLDLALLDLDSAAVAPGEADREAMSAFEVSVFEERVIAGGRVRGEKLLQQTFDLQASNFDAQGSVELELALATLPPSVEWLKLIVRLRLADGRLFLGSLRSVEVSEGAADR